jgi:2-haloacid dehalogenase
MPNAFGFDVYGTLVDPLEMSRHLSPLADDLAGRFAEIWREKQIEYAFRRGLMRRYEDFGVCTKQALVFAMRTLKVDLSAHDQAKLIEEYLSLRAYPDVATGLSLLRAQGHKLVAFSNGTEVTVDALLEKAGIRSYFDDIISVDDIRTFKPHPAVYAYLARRLERSVDETWLISSNSWDVIGAKSAGLSAGWIKRMPDQVFDPWGIEPDVVVNDLEELSKWLDKESASG